MRTRPSLLPAILITTSIAAFSFSFGNRNTAAADPAVPPTVERYLRNYRYLAVETHQKTGIPLPIILAIAGLESDWGTSEIAVAGNNHFGIKDTDWLGPVHCKMTTEYLPATGPVLTRACFRKYKLIAESYHDFGKFISTRKYYQACFHYPAWDYVGWAYQLQYAGYATDPNYAEKLVGLIERYRLYEY